MAISLDSFVQKDFRAAGKVAHIMAEKILEEGLPKGTLLNVNVPAGDFDSFKGFSVTRQGSGTYKETMDRREDPRKRIYYWLSGTRTYDNPDPAMDENAVRAGYVTLTPLHYELTNTGYLDALESWGLKLG